MGTWENDLAAQDGNDVLDAVAAWCAAANELNIPWISFGPETIDAPRTASEAASPWQQPDLQRIVAHSTAVQGTFYMCALGWPDIGARGGVSAELRRCLAMRVALAIAPMMHTYPVGCSVLSTMSSTVESASIPAIALESPR